MRVSTILVIFSKCCFFYFMDKPGPDFVKVKVRFGKVGD